MSQMYNIPTWTEENRTLLDAISQARVSPEASNILQQQLYFNKQKFIDLLDSQPKNSSHRTDLNSSKYLCYTNSLLKHILIGFFFVFLDKAYINRIPHTVSKDFATKALFLSDQLDINEHVAATLLMQGISQVSNTNCNPIDTAVLLFHAERGYLLASLEAILKFANDASINEQVRLVCYHFMAEIMSEAIPLGNNKTGTFTAKVIATLENLTRAINALYTTGTVLGQMPDVGSGKLGEDISSIRTERMGDERVMIVQILYHLASLFILNTQDKLIMLEILEKAQLADPATLYMIVTMLAAISNENQSEDELTSDTVNFAKLFHKRIMTHGAEVPAIKAVIVLQWVLYLTNPVRSDRLIEGSAPVTNEVEIQQLVEGAIGADVFRFLSQYMLYFQQSYASESIETIPIEPSEGLSKSQSSINYREYNTDVCSEFQQYIIHELKMVSESFVRQLFGVLQSLKYKEEDSASINGTELPLEAMQTNDAIVQRRDLEYFLTFLSNVYTGPADSGLIFWKRDDGLNHFARWLLDIKVQTTVCAAFDFFGAISTGVACATGMFNLFQGKPDADLGSSSLFTWRKPLTALEYYTNLLQTNTEESPCHIPIEEELLLLRFLNILKQTVQYCQDARRAFWYCNEGNCRLILQNILKCPTTPQLRAAVFNVISAFCSNWGGGVNGIGRDISLQWWQDILLSDMLVPERKLVPGEKKEILHRPSSLLQEIQLEQQRQLYTETLAIVRLIGTAIHSPSKRQVLIAGFADTPFYVPVGPRTNSEQAGAVPFISLVMDTIFTAIGTDKKEYTEMQWQVTEACLMTMENSIGSFIDLMEKKKLQEGIKGTQQDVEVSLIGYLMHPGFQVLIRILSGRRVVNELFDIVQKCSKDDDADIKHLVYREKCLIKSLHIILNVLELQPILCNVLIPYVAKCSKQRTSSEFQLANVTFPPLPSIANFGQLILFHNGILVQIALLLNYQNNEEICLLSTKILQHLSVDLQDRRQMDNRQIASLALCNPMTKAGANITTLLNTSTSAEDIIFGISERLNINMPEKITCDDYELDINLIPFWKAEGTLGNIYDYPGDVETPALSSVRLAILDLLLENARLETNSPTLTEYLLGYKLTNVRSPVLQDTETNRITLSCLHSILSMLQQGTENSSANGDSMMVDLSESSQPFIDTHPLLAEKCYELIYQLCAKQSISLSTLRYLRNREEFFYKQFEIMSSRFETDLFVESSPFSGTICCADGTEIQSDFFRVRAKLHQRAWLLQSIALELHTTACMEQKANIYKLLELLYGKSSESMSDQGFFSSRGLQQPLVKMLEFVSSLEFLWQDDLTKDGAIAETRYFKAFIPENFYTLNKDGVQVYDIRAMYTFLRTVQVSEYKESIETDLVENEMGEILAACMALNRIKEINHAKRHCMKAWKQVVHITLLECFDLIHVSDREKIIYELLTMLLSKMLSTQGYDTEMLKSMSEVVLALLNRLRKEKNMRTIAQLPVEKLRHVFNGILECICQKNIEVTIRGDLYTSLTNLLLYIGGHGRDQAYMEFEKYMVNYIVSYKTSLLDTLCKDAIDGLEIWKTTAYIAIDSLNTMALRAGSDVIQSYLLSQNFLQYTIEMIRCDDAALVQSLESIDGKLSGLYRKKKNNIIFVQCLYSLCISLKLRCQFYFVLP